jgi:Xaa-Pro aminopeptidase
MAGVSLEERDRRWRNIRQVLKKRSLQALLVVSDGQLERRGSMRYVSDSHATLMWHYVVFPVEGDPVSINVKGGWIKDNRVLPLRGGWVPETEPYAQVIADVIRELAVERGPIGIEGDFMPVPVYLKLIKELPDVDFKLSNIVHDLKKVKSPEEIRVVEQGVEMVDQAFEACIEFAGPGRTWNDITSEACRALYHGGAEDIGGYPLSRSTKIIKPGDSYNLYPEAQASGGYWMQFGRVLSFGEPTKELRTAWEFNIKAQVRGAEKLRPGNTGGDVMRAIQEALKGSGYAAAPRSSGHAVGLDVLEKPFISLDDETVIEPGMVISVHPVFAPPNPAFEACADMFVVTQDKPRKLSRITPEIKVI